MTHARHQIRDLVVAELAAGMATPRTFGAGRQYPIQPNELPAVLVYTRDETGSEERSVMAGPPVIERRVELLVVGVINVDDSDDLADTIAEEAEAVIVGAARQGGPLDALGAQLEFDTIATTISAATETQKAIRVIEIRFPMTYRTRAGAPGTILV